MLHSLLVTSLVALAIGLASGAIAMRTFLQSELVRAQERLASAQQRIDEAQSRLSNEERKRAVSDESANAAQRRAAGLEATLAEVSQTQKNAIQALLEGVKNDLRDATAKSASDRVGELVSPLKEKLTEFDAFVRAIEAKRNEDTGGLKEQIASLLSRSEKLEFAAAQLSTQTSTLVTALRSPATRGKWGEMQLRNLVEKAGMLSYCDFNEQQSAATEDAKLRPDMTITIPGGRRVFVDSKAPLAALQAAFEAVDDSARLELTRQQARNLKEHVDALAKRRYHTAEGSADFVIMFVPGEAFLSSALAENPLLLEYALDKGVFITSPLGLMALLRAFAMGWQAVKQEENAKKIAALGRKLYIRAAKFAQLLAALGSSLTSSVAAYNKAIGSYEGRLLVTGRELKQQAEYPDRDLLAIAEVSALPRIVTTSDAALNEAASE